jgi:hypothetical protein
VWPCGVCGRDSGRDSGWAVAVCIGTRAGNRARHSLSQFRITVGSLDLPHPTSNLRWTGTTQQAGGSCYHRARRENKGTHGAEHSVRYERVRSDGGSEWWAQCRWLRSVTSVCVPVCLCACLSVCLPARPLCPSRSVSVPVSLTPPMAQAPRAPRGQTNSTPPSRDRSLSLSHTHTQLYDMEQVC